MKMFDKIRKLVNLKSNSQFYLGKKVGYEEGVKFGMSMVCEKSESVTKAEFDNLNKYLVDNNLVITYSVTHEPNFTCGLIVRRLK